MQVALVGDRVIGLSEVGIAEGVGHAIVEPLDGLIRLLAEVLKADAKSLCRILRCVCFQKLFFQAEDGIRDFCLSRGLGDVYKRQDSSGSVGPSSRTLVRISSRRPPRKTVLSMSHCIRSVSYTHLTLPTIYSV